jgi:hypothetical protein
MDSKEYRETKAQIKTTFKSDKKACKSLSDNANDICIADAKGKENIALAELNQKHKPTLDTQYKLSMAKGEAAYNVAIQKCDDLAGNPKDVCKAEAKAALTTAKADSKMQLKSADVNNKAHDAKKDIRSEAAADKRAAQLKVEEAKCDELVSTAKDLCLASANSKFGKS